MERYVVYSCISSNIFLSLSVKLALEHLLVAKNNKSGNQKYWNEWREMWSRYLEVLRNLWRLFVLAWCHVTGCHESSGKDHTYIRKLCLGTLAFLRAAQCCLGISPDCLLCLPLVQPRHQHHKGGLSCSLAVCMKAPQRCQDEFPCAQTLFYIKKVQSKYWEVKWLINWKWLVPIKIHLRKSK